MSMQAIRIIIVDDHNLTRESWASLLNSDNRFNVVDKCVNGQEAIDRTRELAPDIILMDINMHPMNGFETTHRILNENPAIKIIGISVNNQPSYAGKMLELGARGFVTKSSSVDEIAFTITEVHEGKRYVCKEIWNLMDKPGNQ